MAAQPVCPATFLTFLEAMAVTGIGFEVCFAAYGLAQLEHR